MGNSENPIGLCIILSYFVKIAQDEQISSQLILFLWVVQTSPCVSKEFTTLSRGSIDRFSIFMQEIEINFSKKKVPQWVKVDL